MTKNRLIIQDDFNTILRTFESFKSDDSSRQNEDALEKRLLQDLDAMGYEVLSSLGSQEAMHANLKKCLERLNDVAFTDQEWVRFLKNEVLNETQTSADVSRLLMSEVPAVTFTFDDGSMKNIYFFKKDALGLVKNHLQVASQVANETKNAAHRYDVMILVNGLPMVHVELKRRGAFLKEAFFQIERYKREGLLSSEGLLKYIQLFVISNGSDTRYFSNTTHEEAYKEVLQSIRNNTKLTSNSFRFACRWTDINNKPIVDLEDFSRTFLAPSTLIKILARYCVFTEAGVLIAMRPYQIAATEAILSRVFIAQNNPELFGQKRAGGYIWHTTGSGKTLTSFKTAQLISQRQMVDKVIFVVDRQDLDYQTMREYEKFKKGTANGTTSTRALEAVLEDPSKSILVTTIQKMANFIKNHNKHDIYQQRVVFIFDECHRSQFGEFHRLITQKFKKYALFGFTGTPIFAENAFQKCQTVDPETKEKVLAKATTELIFGERLHMYSIVDAISDGNVLPFRIDYVNTIKRKDGIGYEEVASIDKEEALLHPERIKHIVDYMLTHYGQKTIEGNGYKVGGRYVKGFNSMLATESVDAAKLYYSTLKDAIAKGVGQRSDLKIALLYSYAQNEELPDNVFVQGENYEDVDKLAVTDKEFLKNAIADYNQQFSCNFSISDFNNYYRDVCFRMKNRELDILVVVNMCLTGFDAPCLNTLWIDKWVHHHGLIQAFSRTNRILNDHKAYGNIVAFRNLKQNTDDAIVLFGNTEARSVVLLRSFRDYLNGYDDDRGVHHPGYIELVDSFKEAYPEPALVRGKKAMTAYVNAWSRILRLRNVLTCFDEFEDSLTPREFADYKSFYLEFYDELKRLEGDQDESEGIIEEIEFEIELVRQDDVNLDYILELIEEARKESDHSTREALIDQIKSRVRSSVTLRDKKDLIDEFLSKLNMMDFDRSIASSWDEFIQLKMKTDLDALIQEESLNSDATVEYFNRAIKDGILMTEGTQLSAIMPKVGFFSGRGEKLQTVKAKLTALFNRYHGIVNVPV